MKCSTNGKSKVKRQKREVKSRTFFLYKNILQLLTFALFLLPFAFPLNACPLCSEAISKVSGLAKGFGWSILIMLAVPFFVVAVIASLVVKAHRQSSPPR
jgi:hypothetical protein